MALNFDGYYCFHEKTILDLFKGFSEERYADKEIIKLAVRIGIVRCNIQIRKNAERDIHLNLPVLLSKTNTLVFIKWQSKVDIE